MNHTSLHPREETKLAEGGGLAGRGPGGRGEVCLWRRRDGRSRCGRHLRAPHTAVARRSVTTPGSCSADGDKVFYNS